MEPLQRHRLDRADARLEQIAARECTWQVDAQRCDVCLETSRASARLSVQDVVGVYKTIIICASCIRVMVVVPDKESIS